MYEFQHVASTASAEEEALFLSRLPEMIQFILARLIEDAEEEKSGPKRFSGANICFEMPDGRYRAQIGVIPLGGGDSYCLIVGIYPVGDDHLTQVFMTSGTCREVIDWMRLDHTEEIGRTVLQLWEDVLAKE